MTTPRPSRRLVLVASSAPATLLLLLLAGAVDAEPPLVGVSPQGDRATLLCARPRLHPSSSLYDRIVSADEAYFAPQVISCRDGSGSFPRSRLNDGYCDCADGTDEPGTPACPDGKFYCRNIGDTPRILFSSVVNDKICDCCDGTDEYESGTHCPNTCRNRMVLTDADSGGRELSVAHLEDTNVFNSKHTLHIEDLIQKLGGLRMAIVIELGLVVCIFAFCFARRRTRTRRRQHILRR